MNYWIYSEPASANCTEPVYHILSERAVIGRYWKEWYVKHVTKNLLARDGMYTELTLENFIKDWVTENWAVPATTEALEKILSAPNPQNLRANNE
jgi:hypothetical protein